MIFDKLFNKQKSTSDDKCYLPNGDVVSKNIVNLVIELDKDYKLNTISEYFKDFQPLKGSYEHFDSLSRHIHCQLLKFSFNNTNEVTVVTDGTLGTFMNLIKFFNTHSRFDKPNVNIIYIMLYSDETNNYVFNANNLILEYEKGCEELIKKRQEKELPKLEKVKEVIKEIL